jgi:CRP-like cAMP-binding protein
LSSSIEAPRSSPDDTAASHLRLMSERSCRAERHRIIRNAEIFAAASALDIDLLADGSRLVVAERGDELFRAGEAAHTFYLVADGAIQVRIGPWAASDGDAGEPSGGEDANGMVLLLQILGPGDIVGDIEIVTLLTGKLFAIARQTSARVLTKAARLVVIEQQPLARVARDRPAVRDRIAVRVLDRLRWTHVLLADVMMASA